MGKLAAVTLAALNAAVAGMLVWAQIFECRLEWISVVPAVALASYFLLRPLLDRSGDGLPGLARSAFWLVPGGLGIAAAVVIAFTGPREFHLEWVLLFILLGTTFYLPYRLSGRQSGDPSVGLGPTFYWAFGVLLLPLTATAGAAAVYYLIHSRQWIGVIVVAVLSTFFTGIMVFIHLLSRDRRRPRGDGFRKAIEAVRGAPAARREEEAPAELLRSLAARHRPLPARFGPRAGHPPAPTRPRRRRYAAAGLFLALFGGAVALALVRQGFSWELLLGLPALAVGLALPFALLHRQNWGGSPYARGLRPGVMETAHPVVRPIRFAEDFPVLSRYR